MLVMKINWVSTSDVAYKFWCKAKKKNNCLVSGNPTDPTFLGPTLKNFLGILIDFHVFCIEFFFQ